MVHLEIKRGNLLYRDFVGEHCSWRRINLHISELVVWWPRQKGQTTVQLKDADPNELQQFIDKMPATIYQR